MAIYSGNVEPRIESILFRHGATYDTPSDFSRNAVQAFEGKIGFLFASFPRHSYHFYFLLPGSRMNRNVADLVHSKSKILRRSLIKVPRSNKSNAYAELFYAQEDQQTFYDAFGGNDREQLRTDPAKRIKVVDFYSILK